MATSSKSTGNPTAALTLSQVAAELGTEADCVLRLIARGALAGTLIGTNYRVTPAALAAYIDGGAPDFKALDVSRDWFPRDPRHPDVVLRKALTEAAKDQRPSDAQLRAAKDGTIAHPEMTIAIRRSAAVVAAAEQPLNGVNPWQAMFKNAMTDARKVDQSSVLDAFIADELHNAARASLRELSTRRTGDLRTSFQQFYDSPQSYSEATKAAATKVAAMSIRWHRTELAAVTATDVMQKKVQVHYVLAIADATNLPIAERIRNVITMAF